MKRKILMVFGTRPEAIKMAPLFLALKKRQELDVRICVSGQHRELLCGILDFFCIIPDYDLAIMKAGQNLFDVTILVLSGLKPVLEEYQPDIVLVHGDTTTAFASALAAFYQKIPVAHIEAGLRTKNIFSPWPEEANRALIGRLANFHFAPTESNKINLLSEGVPEEDVFVVGNTVIDALKLSLLNILASKQKILEVEKKLRDAGYRPCERKIILITGHRRENFGDGFLKIFTALKELAKNYQDVDFVYPVHLNPAVTAPAHEILGGFPNIYLIQPLEYVPFLYLMNRSYFIITDSGGIQEEAPYLGKPVLVTRTSTERPEGIQYGTVKLVGNDPDLIVKNSRELLEGTEAYEGMRQACNPYGDGTASEKIVIKLLDALHG